MLTGKHIKNNNFPVHNFQMIHNFYVMYFQGGKFYLMEHVIADEGTWTYTIQRIIRVPFRAAFECDLMRKPWINLKKAEFSDMKLEHLRVDNPIIYSVFSNQVIGTVTK